MALSVRDLIHDWLLDGRTAWISSGGLHPFALMQMRVDALTMSILEHVTAAQAEPAREGLLDTHTSSEKQSPAPVETTSPEKETQAATKEEPGLKEVSERAPRAMSRPVEVKA